MAARSAKKKRKAAAPPATRKPGLEADLVGQELASAWQEAVAHAGSNRDDRQLLRVVLLEQLNNTRHSTRVLGLIEKILREDAQADKEDRRKQTDAKIRDMDERREADLLGAVLERLNADRREQATEQRENARLRQDLKVSETERVDTSRERNLFMTLTAICVVATVFLAAVTVAFVILTAKYSQPWGYVGSAIGLALTTSTGAGAHRGFHLLRILASTGGESQRGAAEADTRT